jgi:redox-sensing transcriptional repressor
MALSNNATERICRIFGHLKSLEKNCVDFVSSRDLAKAISATEYTVRKDISSLNITGHTRKGYQVKLLKEELGHKLQLTQKRKACIVGLGRLGAALLDYENFQEDGFQIVAGFDCSINRIERIHTHIDVFAVNQLETIVKERGIELGIITVPEQAAQEISDQLCRAGIKGILNFSPAKIIVPKNIIHLDMDFTSALRFIAVRLSIS